jgi:MYXO-CTERM domain-containing protein
LGVTLFGTGATDIGRVSVQGTARINTNRIALDLSRLDANQVATLRQSVLASGSLRTYTVLAATTGLTNDVDATPFNASGFSISNLGLFSAGEWSFGSFDTNTRAVTLVFAPVPEPQAVLGFAALIGLLALAFRRRRERPKATTPAAALLS